MMNPLRGLLAVVAGFAMIASISRPAGAGPVLYIDDANNRLGTVDVVTGAVNVIGNLNAGGEVITDIAFSPTGDLYGISFASLFRIDATTAAATRVGALGKNLENALVFGADGTLYASGGDGLLSRVNTSTGLETTIGRIGFGSAGDLAFNGGSLYMSSTSDQLVRVNLTNGSGSAVGPLGFSGVFGLATGDNGVLYGVSGSTILTINPATGAGTTDLTYGGGLGVAYGTAFRSEAAAVVPEPSSIILGGIAGLIGLGYSSRRRRATAI